MAGRIHLGRAADAPEPVKLQVEAFRREHAVSLPLQARSIDGQILIGRVSELFDVSRQAAEVRLLQLGHLL